MLQDMFTYAIDKSGNYNALSIADNQLRKLLKSDLISKEIHYELQESFSKKTQELEQYLPRIGKGVIPFIICPNPRLLPFEKLFKEIDLGGKPEHNTFFLNDEKIENIWGGPASNTIGYCASCIETGIIYNTENHCLIKYPHDYVIHQTHHASRFSFYECLLLAFYYPDILDVWDGIQSLGSWYGDQRHTLRLYWLNQKPHKYVKVAREDAPLIFDDRFVSPRTSNRICF